MDVVPRTADHGDVTALVAAAEAELAARYGDEDEEYPLDPAIRFVVAYADGVPVGCGALQPLDRATVEVKRMFVVDAHRGRGIARLVLATLERRAAAEGFTAVRLETGTRQPEAIGLYESSGYERTPAYGPYVGNPFSVCMFKRL